MQEDFRPQEDFRDLVGIAEEAAHLAGTFCHREFGRVGVNDCQSKGPNDFFTYVDVRSEELIIEHIRKFYPDHVIMAEESGRDAPEGASDITWHIDPVDGTNNYIRKIPFYAVSIGISRKGELLGGAIFAPEQNEMFCAADGCGAFVNKRRMRVAPSGRLDEATVAFGFPHRQQRKTMANFQRVLPVLAQTGAVRRCGSAALDLAWMACGRFDGYLELGLQKHDIAAGIVIARESGAIVSGLTREEDFFETGNVVAGTEEVHSEIQKILRG
ncbi:MAG: inositol monophosphatase [Gammaproteobacteria bacterium]|nr:inositol monophosphatase [Pseudomonadota bacterium]MCH9663090.1 inositol monophosphatase [Gammaproteobacteria bacterium]